jgi:hypothetical protein
MKGNALRGALLLRGVIAPTCVGEILQASHVAPRGEDLFARLAVSEFITPLFFAAKLAILQAVPEGRPRPARTVACHSRGMAPGPVT